MSLFPSKLQLVVGALLLTLVAAGCGERVEPETELRSDLVDVPPSYVLFVDTFNGSIDVTQGTGPRVEIKATIKQPKELDYSVVLEGDTLRVVAEDRGSHVRPNPGVSLEITTPPNVRLELQTTNGHITAIGVGTSGALDTSNGRLTLENTTGVYTLNTSNGSVNLSGVLGSFGVDTSNGRIHFDGELDEGTETVLRTSNGRISVVIGPDADVRIDAETSRGQIEISYPLDDVLTSASRTVGTLGDGGAKLFLRTPNGGITVE